MQLLMWFEFQILRVIEKCSPIGKITAKGNQILGFLKRRLKG